MREKRGKVNVYNNVNVIKYLHNIINMYIIVLNVLYIHKILYYIVYFIR